MEKNFNDIAHSQLSRIANIAGFSNDVSFFEGKMGVAILLYQGSRYFSNKNLERMADFLIDDVIEEKNKLYELCVNRSCEIFWGIKYLSDSKFLELDTDFFKEIDDQLFRNIDNISELSALNYPFIGNYILRRSNNSDSPDYWKTQIQIYLRNMMKLIISNKGLYRRNTNLLAPFWYTMLMCKEKVFDFEPDNDDLRELSLFFVEIFSALPEINICDAWYQFYSLYNDLEFKYDPSYVRTISDINTIYLNKLLYSDFIMPSDNKVNETLSDIINDKNILQNLNSLLSYQNVGISGYVSGFALSLLLYLQLNE
jgi:hypothetical protein